MHPFYPTPIFAYPPPVRARFRLIFEGGYAKVKYFTICPSRGARYRVDGLSFFPPYALVKVRWNCTASIIENSAHPRKPPTGVFWGAHHRFAVLSSRHFNEGVAPLPPLTLVKDAGCQNRPSALCLGQDDRTNILNPRRPMDAPLPPVPSRRRRGGALSDEIRILRALMRRVEALADEGRSLGEMLSIVETLARASAHLATLLKAERQLESGQSVAEMLNQMLDEVIAEMQANPPAEA